MNVSLVDVLSELLSLSTALFWAEEAEHQKVSSQTSKGQGFERNPKLHQPVSL